MKILTKGILPFIGIAFWLLVSYALVDAFTEELSLLTWWIVAGVPFGVIRMRHWLVPTASAGLGLAACIGILNLIVGGLLGGFVIVFYAVKSFANIVKGIFHMEIE